MQVDVLITTSADKTVLTAKVDIAVQSITSAADVAGDNTTVMDFSDAGVDFSDNNIVAANAKVKAFLEKRETNISELATDVLKWGYKSKIKNTNTGALITVPGIIPPTVSAGPDRTVALPTSTAALDGTVTDPNGGAITYQWTKVSGPAGGTISSPTAVDTNVTALQAGVYVFQLKATTIGGSATDTVTVTVS